jgi:ABC-type phosphate/phosphonate transport system substrate-binding protein
MMNRITENPIPLITLVLLICVSVCTAIFPSASAAQSLQPGAVSVGFSESYFSGVNRTDAEVAFKAYLISVAREHGYSVTAQTTVFRTTTDFESAIRDGKVQVAIIPSWDFVSMDLTQFADPYLVTAKARILEDCVLLTPRNSGVGTFADLRGKNITILESQDSYISKKWVETVLMGERFGTPETFFGSVTTVSKPSAAILPVFFGKYQASVVSRSAFDVMREMNPQVGQKLEVVAASEPLLAAVICLSKTGWMNAKHREDLEKGLANLGSSQSGQQILTLFRVGKLAPYKPEFLDTVKRLKATHDRLAKQSAHLRQ